MALSPKPVERVMLESIAFFDPVDYHRLRRLVGERVNGEYSSERHRTALDNLKELNLIERGGIGHEHIHITDNSWENVGGETPRHEIDVDTVDAPVCTVCAEDELAEANR